MERVAALEEQVMPTIMSIIDTYLRNRQVQIGAEQKANLARSLYEDMWREDFTTKNFMKRIEIYVNEMQTLHKNPKRDLFTELLASFRG